MEEKQIQPGDTFYSHYFRRTGIVTRFVDRNNWWFRLAGQQVIEKARATPEELLWVSKEEFDKEDEKKPGWFSRLLNRLMGNKE